MGAAGRRARLLPVTPEISTARAPELTLIQSLNGTPREMFRENPDTYIWGQDVAYKEKGGIFNVTKGMQQEFGAARVFNGPIAEDFILGTADGFSRFSEKIRVVVEGAEFADYFWPAAEQMVEMSHEYWRTNGQFVPNVTVRIASGGYIGGGLYHSQNIEGWLTTLPGLVVVRRSRTTAGSCVGHASRDLTVYLEPKFLYNAREEGARPAGFRSALRKRACAVPGDLTIVAYGTPVHHALEAAGALAKEGKEVEVLDLRSLVPLDFDAIAQSVEKTSRVLVVHEDKVHGGFGGEIAARITSELFEHLDAPVDRVGSTFTPVGFNRILERAILPDAARVLAAAKKTLAYYTLTRSQVRRIRSRSRDARHRRESCRRPRRRRRRGAVHSLRRAGRARTAAAAVSAVHLQQRLRDRPRVRGRFLPPGVPDRSGLRGASGLPRRDLRRPGALPPLPGRAAGRRHPAGR